ncbi:hypothetical protein [Streptomyces sp. NBC_00648]|uniref:hypothetical protein n=1 Tax=Streptomyces sp. NBC_00648 TaxID=2975797 RepID=UPI003247DC5E
MSSAVVPLMIPTSEVSFVSSPHGVEADAGEGGDLGTGLDIDIIRTLERYDASTDTWRSVTSKSGLVIERVDGDVLRRRVERARERPFLVPDALPGADPQGLAALLRGHPRGTGGVEQGQLQAVEFQMGQSSEPQRLRSACCAATSGTGFPSSSNLISLAWRFRTKLINPSRSSEPGGSARPASPCRWRRATRSAMSTALMGPGGEVGSPPHQHGDCEGFTQLDALQRAANDSVAV